MKKIYLQFEKKSYLSTRYKNMIDSFNLLSSIDPPKRGEKKQFENVVKNVKCKNQKGKLNILLCLYN